MTVAAPQANVLRATIHHAAAMAAIHLQAFPEAPWSATSFATLLAQRGIVGFIDDRGGIVLIRCVADEAEILTIGAATLRQGIGSTLMRAAITQAQTENVATLYLEVAASNIAARGLYHSLGFRQTGRRPNYYASGADALILGLDVAERAQSGDAKQV